MPLYRFYELAIQSEVALPELVEIVDESPPTCRVRFEAVAPAALHNRLDESDDVDDPVTIATDDGTVVSFQCGVDFLITNSADEVVVRHVDGVDGATIRHQLLDHALPRLLAAQGEFVAHASAVNYLGRALIFLGASGHGKSSLAASLHRVGHTLLGDDCFVLKELDDDTLQGMSTYPGLRLLPESIDEFYTDLPDTAFSSMGADYDKVRVVDQTAATHSRPLPVAAIFLIEEPGYEGPPIAAPLSRRDAMLALAMNSFRLDPKNVASLTDALDRAASIAQTVPMFALRYERDFAALGERHQVIFAAVDSSA